jgi:hypothetical protein
MRSLAAEGTSNQRFGLLLPCPLMQVPKAALSRRGEGASSVHRRAAEECPTPITRD